MTHFELEIPACEAMCHAQNDRLIYLHARRYARKHGLIETGAELPFGSQILTEFRMHSATLRVAIPGADEARFEALLQGCDVALSE